MRPRKKLIKKGSSEAPESWEIFFEFAKPEGVSAEFIADRGDAEPQRRDGLFRDCEPRGTPVSMRKTLRPARHGQ